MSTLATFTKVRQWSTDLWSALNAETETMLLIYTMHSGNKKLSHLTWYTLSSWIDLLPNISNQAKFDNEMDIHCPLNET